MVTLASLAVPIVLATVLAMAASALFWMVLPHHRSDFRALPQEGPAADALRGVAPGQYMLPFAGDRERMQSPEMMQRYEQGPVAVLTLLPPGRPTMGGKLGAQFLYHLAVTVSVAYVASRTLPPGTAYLEVFRIVGTVAFLAYSAAAVPTAIWFGRPWGTVAKDLLDGLVLGLLTAGVFGWLWPR